MFEYDVRFIWAGDIDIAQNGAVEWLEARGYPGVCAFVSDHTGTVTLNSLDDVADFERDLSLTVTEVKRVEVKEPTPA